MFIFWKQQLKKTILPNEQLTVSYPKKSNQWQFTCHSSFSLNTKKKNHLSNWISIHSHYLETKWNDGTEAAAAAKWEAKGHLEVKDVSVYFKWGKNLIKSENVGIRFDFGPLEWSLWQGISAIKFLQLVNFISFWWCRKQLNFRHVGASPVGLGFRGQCPL